MKCSTKHKVETLMYVWSSSHSTAAAYVLSQPSAWWPIKPHGAFRRQRLDIAMFSLTRYIFIFLELALAATHLHGLIYIVQKGHHDFLTQDKVWSRCIARHRLQKICSAVSLSQMTANSLWAAGCMALAVWRTQRRAWVERNISYTSSAEKHIPGYGG